MNQPSLNPDVLTSMARIHFESGRTDYRKWEHLYPEIQETLIAEMRPYAEAVLAVAQPEDMPGTYSIGTEEEALRSHERREALKAQPEVQANSKPNQNLEFANSVEELDQLPAGSAITTFAHGRCTIVVMKVADNQWASTGQRRVWTTEDVHAGLKGQAAAVLHRPEVNDA